MKSLAILGGGITGLTLAYLLQDQFKVILIEKSERLGGWIQTVEQDGFLFDLGPRGFRPQGEGEATLALCKQLGLCPLPSNQSAKKRFVLSQGKLRRFGLPYLLSCGLLSSLLKDLCVKNAPLEDECLEAFFKRHLHPKMVARVMDPLVKGIFAGSLGMLSIESCFPKLKEVERKSGSLILGLERGKKKKLPPLYSFEGGMESLTKALQKNLKCEILLGTSINSIAPGFKLNNHIQTDSVISTLLAPLTGKLISKPYYLPMQSLTTVSFGWPGELLPKKGFGYLVPSIENCPYLGMTWDSFIFDQPSFENQTRICIMMEDFIEEQTAIEIALNGVQRELKIMQPPTSSLVHHASDAIAHFPVGHHHQINAWIDSLPQNFYVCGSSIKGKGVNGCVLQAVELAERLKGSLN